MSVPIWAAKYIGIPFLEHGRDSNGVDCWGLLRMIYQNEFNIYLPSFSQEYDHTKQHDKIAPLVEKEAKHWEHIERGHEMLGDVIILRMRGVPMHVGIVIGDYTMLHVESGCDSVIEDYQSMRWKDRITGFFRHRGIRHGGTF